MKSIIPIFLLAMVLTMTGCAAAIADNAVAPEKLTRGTETQRGFVNDNVYHSELGDIHFSSYIPESYTSQGTSDGSEAYALFITLPGWEGLYFHGVGANMVEDFGSEARSYNGKMIVVSPQLNDWGETSAQQTIALTEFLLENYNIDADRVYLEGYSGGGETGSLVMGMRPELYAAFLTVSSQWDGDMETLTASKTPVYLVTGERDSYYGSEPMKNAYARIRDLYLRQGLSDAEIDKLLVLDVKEQNYFTERGYTDQHGGGMAIAKDEKIMSWLFEHTKQKESAGAQIPVHIIAGETIVEAVLYDNATAHAFADMLPLTVDLWTPIHYAQAFDLSETIPDQDERTRVYERGAIGYWYEGPSIALLYGKDETRTAVPIVKIGKMNTNISVFETYRDAVTVERVEE